MCKGSLSFRSTPLHEVKVRPTSIDTRVSDIQNLASLGWGATPLLCAANDWNECSVVPERQCTRSLRCPWNFFGALLFGVQELILSESIHKRKGIKPETLGHKGPFQKPAGNKTGDRSLEHDMPGNLPNRCDGRVTSHITPLTHTGRD